MSSPADHTAPRSIVRGCLLRFSTHPPSTTTWDARLDALHRVQRPRTFRGLSSPEPHNLRPTAGALPSPSPATTTATECSPEHDVFPFAQAAPSSARIKLRRWPAKSLRARQIGAPLALIGVSRAFCLVWNWTCRCARIIRGVSCAIPVVFLSFPLSAFGGSGLGNLWCVNLCLRL